VGGNERCQKVVRGGHARAFGYLMEIAILCEAFESAAYDSWVLGAKDRKITAYALSTSVAGNILRMSASQSCAKGVVQERRRSRTRTGGRRWLSATSLPLRGFLPLDNLTGG
jgi:hypothetical protein